MNCPTSDTSRRKLCLRLAAAALAVCSVLAAGRHPAQAADDLWQQAAQTQANYFAAMQDLAKWCLERGLQEQAVETRLRYADRDPYKLYLTLLKAEIGPPPLPSGASDDLRQWHTRFWRMRREYAEAAFALAREAIRNRQPSLAYQLAIRAIRENPDDETLRRLMGYQKYRDRWCTYYEVRQLRAGKVWDERFGWIPEAHLDRYEQGLRPSGSRWIPAEEDARRHADIQKGWDIETEHYAIRTNHSIEAGVALGQKLERLFDIWTQLFIRYYASEADVAAMFEGRTNSARRRAPKFHVVYFRDRDDYNRSLKAALPNIEMSVGVYLEQTRRAYFFAGPDADDRTLFHEATHQLFHQSRPVAPDVARQANFWIVEGIAMYMETLHQEGDELVLGGLDDVRFHAARYRLLHDNFYVPLDELCGWGMQRVQQDSRIATLYSQAAGLTHFLVYHDQGRYRDALVAYLSTVYSGRDNPQTLSRLTGASYTQLDRLYREFIEQAAARAAEQSPETAAE